MVHLADLHLGFRAYHRLTPRGVNVREADVSDAFREAIERTVALRPDLVLVAGDVFHTVRPSNSAIADAFRQFSSLTARLPGVPVVVIAGNHDSPRSADTGNILALFREIPGVEVVADAARAVRFPALDASVLCLPHNVLASEHAGVALEPDPAARSNVLMLHGTVGGSVAERKMRYVSEFGGAVVEDTQIGPERWDYVALGHYHIATELAPNMWYAGGVERTSTNVWMEAEGAKGFLLFDTDTRRAEFHPLHTRPVVDLPRISARGHNAEELDEALLAAVERIPDGIADKIVRLVIQDLPRHVFREMNHRRIRDFKAEALHFHLDARPPEVRRQSASGAPIRRQTLREQVGSYLRTHWQLSSEALDRDRLVSLGDGYLAATEEG
ncbi:MAG: exonuclease SbcCD subunit D [Gemmatimonadota bacterium]|jgi:DNA repair exonuclease SbcCD nuclease subunit|nr:exonuclease SbcCD subunit D [Gemmatimonadota bacterium]